MAIGCQKPGVLVEETHYYGFGLAMAGISSKALKPNYRENKRKFNDGTELQNKEFSDNSGLEWYATDFRSYDPQIGRFVQVDDIAEAFEDWSPYTFSFNNPILFNDPTGLAPNDTTWHVLPEVTVTAKAPVQLDTENGQVLPSLNTRFGSAREWNGYYVNGDGYLETFQFGGTEVLRPYVEPTLLEMPDVGKKAAAKAVANKWLVYRAYKRVNGKLKLYIGKAKNALEKRYSKAQIKKLNAAVIQKLDDIPDNATALGVEQAILTLNGGVAATANINNAAVKKAYVEAGLKWLNENIPNWKEVFKFQ